MADERDPLLDELLAERPDAEEGDDGLLSAVDDLAGRRLGPYRVGPLLGGGAMGRVYRAEHAGLGRTCALKVLSPKLLALQPSVLDNFLAEARALAGLMHPHIVTVYNQGSDLGYHYIEMEYVPGGVSLQERLTADGAVEPVAATILIRQVVDALGAAHRSHLVHRDVKPANVLLTADGRAKLADFGLARRIDAEWLGVAAIAGTPTMMAPELFGGATPSPHSDLYAAGVMYYYILSTRLPFASDRLPELIAQHRKAPVPDVRDLVFDVPDEVAAIIARCLAKRPEDRYGTADELADDLQGVILDLRDMTSLVREGLSGLNCIIEGDRRRAQALLPMADGRLQEIRVEVGRGRQGRRLLSVYSVCGPADARHYELALKLNAEMAHGGLSIRDVDGRPMLVVARPFPGGDPSAAEIRAAILEIAARGDWVERQLTQAGAF